MKNMGGMRLENVVDTAELSLYVASPQVGAEQIAIGPSSDHSSGGWRPGGWS